MAPAAGLLRRISDGARLRSEVPAVLDVVGEIRRTVPGLSSWVNFPLWNATGDSGDLSLGGYRGAARPTGYADRLPGAAAVVRRVAALGFDLSHARVAVLLGRDVLRPHVDMVEGIRLIVPMNDQGTDFRHVFDGYAVAMRAGELWAVDGRGCHGAANVSARGARVALLLDARPESRPADWAAAWRVPDDRRLVREPWTAERRSALRTLTGRRVLDGDVGAAEREWHLVPFEYDVGPDTGYTELVALFEDLAAGAAARADAAALRERAEFWRRHTCVCVA